MLVENADDQTLADPGLLELSLAPMIFMQRLMQNSELLCTLSPARST